MKKINLLKNNYLLLLVLLSISPLLAFAEDNEKIGPADNFYLWSNHKWLEESSIPDDKPRVDNFTDLEDLVTNQLSELFKQLKSSKSRTSEQEKLMRLYDGFINLDLRDQVGILPIKEELAKIDAASSYQDIAKLFAHFQIIGISTPVILNAEADFKNSTMNIGVVSQSGLGIERDYYLGSDQNSLKQQKLYDRYLTKLFKLASIKDAKNAVKRVIEIENKLAEIQWSEVENRDMQNIYNPMSIKDYTKLSSNYYGSEILSNLAVPKINKLSIKQPSYIKNYCNLFKNTSIDTWQDYARARLLVTYANLLSSDFRNAYVEYQIKLGLINEEQELWKEAIDFVSDSTNMLLGKAYVEKFYDQKTKDDVTKLVLSIRDTYRDSIEQSSWMSKITKNKALEKLDKMQFKIGYPDHWKDYSVLELSGANLVENYKLIKIFDHKLAMAKIGKPVNRDEWEYSPHEVNASYEPSRNEFVLLAAILHAPLYNANGSPATKYGRLGFIIGHEIGHGFDDQGSLFDGDGNLVNWWKPEDLKAYNEKKQILIQQANAYQILPGTYLKGEQEIGEIMGDLSGAQIALRAYKKTKGASEKEFFKQLSKTWRSKWRDEFLLLVLHQDVHPPSEFRSNGIVKQFDEFYKAFNIKPTDNMYLAPENRVLMW